jgi:hypothetical protein
MNLLINLKIKSKKSTKSFTDDTDTHWHCPCVYFSFKSGKVTVITLHPLLIGYASQVQLFFSVS